MIKRISLFILFILFTATNLCAQENVLVTTPIKGNIDKLLSFTGETRPILESYAAADVSGPVIQILVQNGDKVKAGQALAKIDPVRFSIALELMQANLAIAKQEVKEIERNFERNKKLYDKNAITQKTFDRVETELIRAKSVLKQASANHDKAKLDLARCIVKAPIDGYFIDRNLEVGQAMARGQNMGRVINLDHIFVDANIPETEIQNIKIGQKCLIENKYTGTVAHINLNADQSRSFQVKIKVENPNLYFKANMFVKGQITLKSYKDIPLVPSAAIRNEKGKPYIYVVKKDEAQKVPVEIISQKGEYSYLSPVSFDQKIVTVGQDNLSEKTKVVIRNKEEK
jgi:RND family efflux transporter MFP subunit